MMDLKDYQKRRDLLGRWYDRVIKADELLQVGCRGSSRSQVQPVRWSFRRGDLW